MIPVRFQAPEKFAALYETLDSAGYTEENICRHFGVSTLAEIDSISEKPIPSEPPRDLLSLLIRLFLELGAVEATVMGAIVPRDLADLLRDFDLLHEYPLPPERYYASVALYPIRGVYLISDRWRNPEPSQFRPAQDFVYPAMVSNTHEFLSYLSGEQCDNFLDLCAGTGVAALIAARDFARKASAFDIAPRSGQFAEFNRRLNGLDNASVRVGDLYEPAGDETFDRIVAHPPYMPVLRAKWIYHDGGQDGEHVTRRIIEGLGKRLRPGGQFYMLAMGTDRGDAPYEYRLREWLGTQQEQFDIALVVKRLIDPAQYAVRSVLKGAAMGGEALEWKQLFKELNVAQLVYGIVVIQRNAKDRPAFTVRRDHSERTRLPEIEWMLDWETDAAGSAGVLKILHSRLRASRDSELRVRHSLENGDWTATEYQIVTGHPFLMETTITPWIAMFLSRCDGSMTGHELLEQLKREESVAPGTQPVEFADALLPLVSGGFLQLEKPA